MDKQTSRRYTLRLTAELEELIEAHRVELARAFPHMVQNPDGVTAVYAIRHLIGNTIVRFLQHVGDNSVAPPELRAITGTTTRTIKVTLPHGQIELLAEHAGLSIHATLRALIVAGAGL